MNVLLPHSFQGQALSLNGAQGHPCLVQRLPDLRVPSIDVTAVLGVALGRCEGRAVDQVTGNRVLEVNAISRPVPRTDWK